MSEERINKVVPKLRFPEFSNIKEWNTIPLGVAVKSESSTLAQNKLQFVNSGYPVYGADGIIGFANFFIQNDDYIAIIKDGSGVGRLFLYQKKSSILGTLAYLKSQNNTEYHLTYLFYLLQTINLSTYIKGSGIPHIYYSDYSKTLVAIPTSDEQQKIADCLSSFDTLITAQKQKLEALKTHKKGLMQQLFPAVGEMVPKLRFTEFRDKWQKNKLEHLIDLLSGYAFQSEFFSNEGVKILTPKNFTKDGYGNFTKENTKYTTENFDTKYICKEGDLLLLLTDLTPSCELLGKPILLKKENGEVLLNQRIVKIVSKADIETRFLLYFFSTESFHQRIKNTASGSTVRHSSNTIIRDTEIWFPSNNEQQKIANCLSSLDDLISAQKEKIEALKQHKKGLMQQLFPNINE